MLTFLLTASLKTGVFFFQKSQLEEGISGIYEFILSTVCNTFPPCIYSYPSNLHS